MTFAHPLPWWVLAFVLAATLWLAWRGTARPHEPLPPWPRVLLTALRLAVVVLLLALVMRPVRVDPSGGHGARLAVVVDRSVSMNLADIDGRSRLDTALEGVRRLLPALPASVDVETFALGPRLEKLDSGVVRADAVRTDLDAALGDLRSRPRPFSGMLFVSDGAIETGGELGRDLPIAVVPLGAQQRGRDRGVLAVSVGEPVASDESVDLAVTLVQHGAPNEPFDVRVGADGSPVETRRVAAVAPGVPVHALFRVVPAEGRPTTFTVDVPPALGEATALNNHAAVVVPPAGEPRRVLVLEGGPGHEHSFLKRAWLADRGLLVDAVVRKGVNDAGAPAYYLQTATDGAADLTGGFPATLAALCRYDVVVLANTGAGAFTASQIDRLAYFVAERGGGLVVLGRGAFDARAWRGTPLDALLPLDSKAQWSGRDRTRPGALGVTLLSAGETHPLMRLGADATRTLTHWAALPALSEIFGYGGPRPGATVLAVAPAGGGVALPLVVTQPFGRGRVLAFTGEASWRWKMGMPSDDRTYDTFWQQVVRWASARKGPIAVSGDTDLQGGLVARVMVRDADFAPVSDADVTVSISGSDDVVHAQRAVLVDPASGVYETTRPAPAPGPARIRAVVSRAGQPLGTDETWWSPPLAPEVTSPWRDDRTLRRVADQTGGRVLDWGDVPRWVAGLSLPASSSAQASPRDLWHRWGVLTVVVTLLAAEWALRRRWGLR